MNDVREIREGDWSDATHLMTLFRREGEFPGRLDPLLWVNNWRRFIEMGIGHVLVFEKAGTVVGMIAGFISEDPNDGDKVAQEAFWYVHQDHRTIGMNLLRAWMAYVKDKGCKRLTMVHLFGLQSERLGEIYKQLGMAPLETHYWINI